VRLRVSFGVTVLVEYVFYSTAYQVSRWRIDCMVALMLVDMSLNAAGSNFFSIFV